MICYPSERVSQEIILIVWFFVLNNQQKLRIGVSVGSGIGGLETIENNTLTLKEKGPKRVSPFFIPGALITLVAVQISIRNNFKGPNLASVTACSSGTHSIFSIFGRSSAF